jgi:hypothetical protein
MEEPDPDPNARVPYFSIGCRPAQSESAEISPGQQGFNHRVHRVATAAVHSIMRVKLAQTGEGGGALHAHPLSLHLPSPVKLQCTLQLSGQTH